MFCSSAAEPFTHAAKHAFTADAAPTCHHHSPSELGFWQTAQGSGLWVTSSRETGTAARLVP